MMDGMNPWLAGAAGALAGIVALLLVARAMVTFDADHHERDCETICTARHSACRAVTAWGPLCHDGSMPGRCE